MKRAWIGLALLAGLWLLWVDYYHQPVAAWLSALVLVIGVVLLGAAPARLPNRGAAAVGGVLALAAVWLVPWPYNVGPILIVVGLAIGAMPVPSPWDRRLGGTALAAGVVLLAQWVALAGHQEFTARYAQLPMLLSRMLEQVVRLMGMDASFNGQTITVFAMRENQPFAATWSLLLDPVTLGFAVGAIVLIALQAWSQRASGRQAWQWRGRMAAVILGIAVWLPMRAGLLMALVTHRVLRTGYDDPLNLMNQFWSPWLHLALLAVPILLVWRFVNLGHKEQSGRDGPMQWPAGRNWFTIVTAAVGVAALTAAVIWTPIGTRKEGRVLVDEYHSNAPWPGKTFDTVRTNRRFDKDWYGKGSAYNLACMYDYCSRFYEMSRTEPFVAGAKSKDVITKEALKDIDVLVLKVPSEPYSGREVAAVRGFVERGGGLLLIGEHTSVFGSGAYLNQIAQEYGFEFRYDCLFGVDEFFRQRYEPPLVRHPIIERMPAMDFAISCSIDPSKGRGQTVVRGTGLKSLGANYHAVNFYPATENRAEMLYGAFVQVWATRAGKGRVVGFSDSTIFASFAAFEPGRTDLMLGMLEWLNHSGGWMGGKWVLAGLGLVLLLAAVISGRKWDPAWLVILTAGLLGWAASVKSVCGVERMPMPAPLPEAKPMIRIAMDRTISEAPLPRNGFIGGKEGEFGQFERCILRLGYFPFRAAGADVTQGDAVVILNPTLKVEPEFRKLMVQYVHDGGKLLVLDSVNNLNSTANSLLHPFNLSSERVSGLSGNVTGPEGFPVISVDSSRRVKADEAAVLARVNSYPVAAMVRHGKGSVTLIGFGSRFDARRMGIIGDVVPDAKLRPVFDYVFSLFEMIIAGSKDPPDPKLDGSAGENVVP